jgi:hypothetical protein
LKRDEYFWPSEIKKTNASYNSVISNSHTPADHSSLKNINSQIEFDRKPKFLTQSQPKFLDRKSSFDFIGKNKSSSGVNYSFKSHRKCRLTREDRRKQCSNILMPLYMPVFSDVPEINQNLVNNKIGITANGAFECKIFSEQAFAYFSEPNFGFRFADPRGSL